MSENKRKASNQGTLFKFFKKQIEPEEAPDGTEKAGSGSMSLPVSTENTEVHRKPEEDGNDGCNLNAFHPNDIGLYIHGQVNIKLFAVFKLITVKLLLFILLPIQY